MTRKLSALDKSRGKSKLNLDPLALATTVLMAAGIALSAFGLFQTVVYSSYKSAEEATSQTASNHATAVAELLRGQQSQLLELSTDPDVVAALAGTEADRARIVNRMVSKYNYERALLVPPRVNQFAAEPYPGPDYAALSVAILAQATRRVSDPLYTSGDELGRVHWAAPVRGDSGPIGILVVTLDATEMVEPLKQAEDIGGYLDLRRKTISNITQVLAAYGTPVGFGSSGTLEAPSAFDFSIGYATARPFGLSSNTLFGALVWLILGLLALGVALTIRLLPKIKAGRAQQADVETDEPRLDDILDEELKAAMDFTKDIAQANAGPAVGKPAEIDAGMFRAYDIRGVVGQTLTADAARLIGHAIGSEARRRSVGEIVVARDGRHSGPELQAALIEGITAAGVDVTDIGAVPTGILYFATFQLETGAGVMVTGSHNPPDYNGFKIMLEGQALYGDDIRDLHRRIIEGDLETGSGGAQETSVIEDYVDRIASDIQVEEPLRVVVDCGSGIPGMIAPRVLEEIGCEVIPLYCDVDGDFPHHHPDPSDPKNLTDLITSVENLGADLGVAFDGDGDRLGVVTRAGEIIYPDRLLMLFAQDVLLRNPGATIIYDVKCTGHLARVVLENGGSPLMWKTGHSLIKAKMKAVQAALAGEMSGHFFFKERWYGFDDGIYAAARLLEILAAEPDGGESILAELPNSVSTPELKVEMNEGENYVFMDQFSSQASFPDARITNIDGIRADYDDGWGLVRCSNTTPCLVLRFDAERESALDRIKEVFRQEMLKVRPDLKLPF